MEVLHRVLFAVALATSIALTPLAPDVRAQPSTPGADMLEQDRLLGPGCNEIGRGIPMSDRPLQPSQAWLDDHSVCVGDRLVATGMCYGITDGKNQVELCAFYVARGDASMSIDCSDIALDTEIGVFGPHPELTNSMARQSNALGEDRNVALPGPMRPCTSSTPLSDNAVVVAAFDGLTPTNDPVVLQVNVEMGKFVAIVSDEPTLSIDDSMS